MIPEIEIKIKYKIKGKKFTPENLEPIKDSEGIVNILRKIFNADTIEWTEEFIMISLNRANKVIGYYKVSKGGMTGTIADPKVIFTMALNSGATSIIVAHNHPSGNLQPSPQDRQITTKLINAGELLDIKVLDHIILTSNRYYSFLDEGEMV